MLSVLSPACPSFLFTAGAQLGYSPRSLIDASYPVLFLKVVLSIRCLKPRLYSCLLLLTPPHVQIFKVLSLKTQSFNNSFSYSHLSNERPGNGSTATNSPLALASSSSSPLWILKWLLLAQQKSLITFPASWSSFLGDTVNGIRQ